MTQADHSEGMQGLLRKWVPGYDGYLDEENRRREDKEVREFLARKLDDGVAHIEKAKLAMVNGGLLMHLAKVETPRTRIMKYRDKIRFATYGYSGWFAAKTIDAAQLERIVGYDKSLYDEVEKISGLCEELDEAAQGGEDLNPLLAELATGLSRLEAAVQARDDMMKE